MGRPIKQRRICAMPEDCGFLPVGGTQSVSITLTVDEYEVILMDLCSLTQEEFAARMAVASTNTQADLDLQPILEEAGVTVTYFDASTFTDYLAMLKTCTDITNCTENYIRYGTDVVAQVNAATAVVTGPAPRVLYLRASGSSVKVKNSEGSVLGEMLADLGCQNIADNDTSLLENLSLEAILAEDSDKIFIVLQGADEAEPKARLEADLLANPAWQQLTVVQNGEVYYMEHALYNLKPNDKWGTAYENLPQILYGT